VRTVVIVNQKGGCGKTTTAINLAGVFASRGLRSLLVDLDPQSHCAAGLAIPEQRIDLDIADALVADVPLDRSRLVWSAGRNLDLIPSRTRLAGLEAARGGLATKPDKERRLGRVIERFAAEYDVAFVDCSPSIGLLTYNAITAATDILVPVETGFFSLQGAMKQARTIESLQRRLGVNASYWLLPTLHEAGSALAEDLLQELRRRFGAGVLPVTIRRDIKLREAVSFGQPVIEYEPESTGARDYGDLADWLVRRWETAAPDARPALPVAASVEPIHERPVLVGAPSEPVPGLAVAQAEPKPAPRDDRVAEIAALARKLREATLASAVAGRPSPTRTTVTLDPTPPIAGTFGGPVAASRQLSVGRELLGARQTDQGVLFVQPLSAGRQIAVAGDFNGWSTRATRMTADTALGVHQACVHLPPGRHRYRLVIDGRWTADPHNGVIEPNEFGETNSVVVVRAPMAVTAG
jgi:chromosome partitioning protein